MSARPDAARSPFLLFCHITLFIDMHATMILFCLMAKSAIQRRWKIFDETAEVFQMSPMPRTSYAR